MRRRILIIEDDPNAAKLAEYALEQEGYQVLTADNGLDGIRKALQNGPHLVILDVMLPGLDGYEVCYELRRQLKNQLLPIIMISAKARPEDKDIGYKMGASDYLVKPVGPSQIVARVKSLLAEVS